VRAIERSGKAGPHSIVGAALVREHRHGVTAQRWNSLLEACEEAVHGEWSAMACAAVTGLLTVLAHLPF
jgi:hypothetical protein